MADNEYCDGAGGINQRRRDRSGGRRGGGKGEGNVRLCSGCPSPGVGGEIAFDRRDCEVCAAMETEGEGKN